MIIWPETWEFAIKSINLEQLFHNKKCGVDHYDVNNDKKYRFSCDFDIIFSKSKYWSMQGKM